MANAHLPVEELREEFLAAISSNQCVVVIGPTGSGKTTRIPIFLMEGGYANHGMIGVTEPRRVAAVSVAAFVSSGFEKTVGGLVGYQIRHENKTSEWTRIKYMTEGILLRELLADPYLKKYDCVVLDEVHERGVNQDLLLALIRDLLPHRPDLKIVVMSATIENDRFAEYFSAPIVAVKGRSFPIDIIYEEPTVNCHIAATTDGILKMLTMTDGDLLAFVPDYDSIRQITERLDGKTPGVTIHHLYGNQSPEEQMAVFERHGRAVILATNVAETSITLDGVTGVIDTGLIKEMRYHPGAAFSSLKVVEHSKAGCEQRAGRAGRTAPGIVMRLFSQENFANRLDFTQPEIQRTSLDQVLLQLTAMGFTREDIVQIDFLDAPSTRSWHDADRLLQLLEAIRPNGQLTKNGAIMAELPLPPAVTRMILTAEREGCVLPIITVAASFSTRPVFVRPIGQEEAADAAHLVFRDARSDFLTLLNVLDAWRGSDDRESFAAGHFLHSKALSEIDAVESQIAALLFEHGIVATNGRHPDRIGRAVTAGLIANLAWHERGRNYGNERFDGIVIHPSSSVCMSEDWPEYVVAAEMIETTRLYARNVQCVPRRWLSGLVDTKTMCERRRDTRHESQKRRHPRKGRQKRR